MEVNQTNHEPLKCVTIQFTLQVFQSDFTNATTLYGTLEHLLTDHFRKINVSNGEIKCDSKINPSFNWTKEGKFTCQNSRVRSDKKIQDDCFSGQWKGWVTVNHLTNFFNHFSTSTGRDAVTQKIGLLWKFIGKNDEPFIKLKQFTSAFNKHSQSLEIKGISFGNLINGTRFVKHSPREISSTRTTSAGLPRDSIVNLNHTQRKMNLQINITVDSKSGRKIKQKFKLDFDYKSIKQVIISQSELGTHVYFHLRYPPKIFIATEDLDPYQVDMVKSKFQAFDYNVYRQRPGYKQYFKTGRGFWTRWYDTNNFIGKSSVFALNLSSAISNQMDHNELVAKFYAWRNYSNLDVTFGFIQVTKCHPFDLFPFDLPFNVNYALQSIQSISNSFQDDLIVNNQVEQFRTFVKDQIIGNNSEKLITSLNRLFYEYLYGQVDYSFSRLKAIFKRVEKDWSSIKEIKSSSNSYIKQLRRVILTPTRVLILPELAFQSSQFLEMVDRDNVLRLNIRDEDMNNLGYAVGLNEEDHERNVIRNSSGDFDAKLPSPEEYFLYKCIADRLLPRLDIAGKSYRVFGSSSSQFRDFGLVLYAKDDLGHDSISIRNKVGLTKSRERSKVITSVKLSLTQVLAFVELPADIVLRYTKDVIDGQHPLSDTYKPYNFTDGCGLMSIELAEYIWSDLEKQGAIKLDPEREEKMSTAYQIRFMGCKGMIVVDESLSGKVMVLRESMRKVYSIPCKLGIVKLSGPRRAYLNRPLVTILNQIGLSNDFFDRLLLDTIEDLLGSFRCSTKASKALKMYSCLHRFIDHYKLTEKGYNLLGDYFFRNALHLVFHQGLDLIKQKARIPLDMATSRTLFGVADPTATHHLPYVSVPTHDGVSESDPHMIKIYDHSGKAIYSSPVNAERPFLFNDETEKKLEDATTQNFSSRQGRLKYGQVFVYPSDFEKPLVGDVIVTKFPCMDPGDVQRFKAVDIPELHGIRDCIVFPVDGPRPHSDEMAGSDLDGDEYSVIWSSDFMDIDIERPMDFPVGVRPSIIDESNMDREIVSFFTHYVQHYATGRIAYSHLVWSDLLDEGIFSICSSNLSVKYSEALDSVATGKSVNLSESERYEVAPDFFDHWPVVPSYHSFSALGSIYRTVSIYKMILSRSTQSKLIEAYLDPRLVHPGSRKYMAQATKAYDTYCSILTCLLEMTGYTTEAEIFTQMVGNSEGEKFAEAQSQRANDYQDTLVNIIDRYLVKKMEEDFYSEFDQLDENLKQEAFMAKASAYYKVTKKKNESRDERFYGLPWIGKYSSHLIQLLETSKNQSEDKLLETEIDVPSSKTGFFASKAERQKTAQSCWRCLSDWCRFHLSTMNVAQSEWERIISQLRFLFYDIANFYISKDRKTESPSVILTNIFALIGEKRNLFEFEGNLFNPSNEPMVMMAFLILESTYCQGIESSKVPDYWVNSSFRVFYDNCGGIDELKKRLKEISKCTRIVETLEKGDSEYFTLSIRGSGTSVLICQMAIGIHNYIILNKSNQGVDCGSRNQSQTIE